MSFKNRCPWPQFFLSLPWNQFVCPWLFQLKWWPRDTHVLLYRWYLQCFVNWDRGCKLVLSHWHFRLQQAPPFPFGLLDMFFRAIFHWIPLSSPYQRSNLLHLCHSCQTSNRYQGCQDWTGWQEGRWTTNSMQSDQDSKWNCLKL